MKYAVRLKPRAEKELKTLSKKDRGRVLLALLDIRDNPFAGKKLEGEYKDCYSARVWPYRIVYYIDKKKILIVVLRIGHRKEIYH